MADAPTLYLAATGHVYAGLCPDDSQPDSRDDECPACLLLMQAQQSGPSDAQMLDWLESMRDIHIDHYLSNGKPVYILRDRAWGRVLGSGDALRAAIRAAMQAKGGA